MKKTFKLCGIVALCGLCSCVGPSTKEVYRDAQVNVTERTGWFFLSPHMASSTTSIFVFGKKYKDVRGYQPYYLEIPEKDAILFVTGPDHNGDGNAIVHLVNLKTKGEKHCCAFDSHIGSNIYKQNGQQFEEVESVSGDKLVIRAGFSNARFRYHLDLAKPEFEKEEGMVPNRVHGGQTNLYVWPKGKALRN